MPPFKTLKANCWLPTGCWFLQTKPTNHPMVGLLTPPEVGRPIHSNIILPGALVRRRRSSSWSRLEFPSVGCSDHIGRSILFYLSVGQCGGETGEGGGFGGFDFAKIIWQCQRLCPKGALPLLLGQGRFGKALQCFLVCSHST